MIPPTAGLVVGRHITHGYPAAAVLKRRSQRRSVLVADAKRSVRRDDDSDDPLAADASRPSQPAADAGEPRCSG